MLDDVPGPDGDNILAPARAHRATVAGPGGFRSDRSFFNLASSTTTNTILRKFFGKFEAYNWLYVIFEIFGKN